MTKGPDRVVVVTRDLMDGGRFRAAMSNVTVVRSLSHASVETASLIVLDLASGIDPLAAVAIGPDVVAYGSHVEVDKLEAAIEAGCVEAVARSVIFRRAADQFC